MPKATACLIVECPVRKNRGVRRDERGRLLKTVGVLARSDVAHGIQFKGARVPLADYAPNARGPFKCLALASKEAGTTRGA
jgi:hypothetical protein